MVSTATRFQFHSDGGRNSCGSSAAYSILVWSLEEGQPTRKLISVYAEFIPHDVTPFYSECLALLRAFQAFKDILKLRSGS